jgi:3-oxoacyl-[acyl-carrier protein] reductase
MVTTKRYDGQVAVVTGASSGIGRRLAVDLARRGATIIGLARREVLLKELEQELAAHSPSSETVVCDVSQTDGYADALHDIERRHGRIDILINNAGIERPTPVTNGAAGIDAYRDIMENNFFAVVSGTLAVMPGMVARRAGIVVNVSSDTARAPTAKSGAYAASKAAISAFSESVTHDVADLYPGWVPTAMGRAGAGDDLPPKPVRRTEEQISQLVLERMGREAIEINAARLALLAPIARSLLPVPYQRGVRKATAR